MSDTYPIYSPTKNAYFLQSRSPRFFAFFGFQSATFVIAADEKYFYSEVNSFGSSVSVCVYYISSDAILYLLGADDVFHFSFFTTSLR